MSMIRIETTDGSGMLTDARVGVEFQAGDEAKALEALNRAYAEARTRIEAGLQ